MLEIAVTGFYRVYVNGKDVTKGYFAPQINNPDQIVFYDEYDVTKYLKKENVVCFLLGNGFNNSMDGGVWDFEKASYRSAPRLYFRVYSDETIAESDEGRTFTAFYRFLSSELSTREIEELVDALSERPFWGELEERRRDAIADIQTDLSHRARETQQVMKRLASSLRYFVQSREYQQNRRLSTLIDDARKLALEVTRTKAFSATSQILEVDETFASVTSVGDVSLYDPENAGGGETLQTAEVPVVDLAALAERLAASEINYAWLKETIERCLKERETVTIGDVMTKFPARQGLASVVGYIHLAIQYAEAPKEGKYEMLQWTNRFKETMRGRLPDYVFVRGCFD